VPLSSGSAGAATDAVPVAVDARWTMAYAAALGDALACYFDTRRSGGVVAHPLFPVAFEWPVFLATHGLPGNETLGADERRRGVHATHDLSLARPIRAGETLETRARVASVERRPPGAYQLVRLDTRDAAGEPVCTTWYGSLYRGVGVAGPDRPPDGAPPPPGPLDPQALAHEVEIPVSAGMPHVYTECARIWNPIHTDAAVAERAGLPGIVLHGTATLALAVSQGVAACGGDPTRVARVAARFGALVRVPSTLRLRMAEPTPTPEGDALRFEVRNADGEPAIRDGLVTLRG
jgi:acyl dehydratase